MTTDNTHFTVGKTTFFQGENQTHPALASSPASRLLHRPVEILRIMQYLWELACQR